MAERKMMIILGTASCLEDDLENFREIDARAFPVANGEKRYQYLAVGVDCADRYLGRIDHAVSYHPREFKAYEKDNKIMPGFYERRQAAGGNLDYQTHTHSRPELGHRVWPYFSPSGSSAMLGVEVALGLGYDKIIVCGCPLTDKGYARFQKGWDARLDKIKDKVRAMSGYPRQLLGAPTEEWLTQ